MLQLVGMHLEVRRAIVVEQGIDRLVDMDAFLSATLAAFDSGGRDDESRATADRDRLDWLRGLSDAYIAIASGRDVGGTGGRGVCAGPPVPRRRRREARVRPHR